MRYVRLACCVSAASLAIALATPAIAQTAPVAPAPEAMDAPQTTDIVVTANKRSETAMSVPASVTAISGAALADKGIYSVQDLVKVTPGLSYVESGRSVPVFSLRGVGFFDQSLASRPTVSVYVDEAPIPFSIESKGAAFDLQRVEVLKGPQGTLFGQNATGGAINYIAAKPTDTFHAGATASYARFGVVDVQGYVSGPISSTLDARLALRTVQGGDWQRSYTRDDTLGAQDFTQGRFILAWKPNDRLSVRFDVNGFYDRSDTQAPQFTAFAPGTPAQAKFIPLLATYPLAPADDRAADWDQGKDYRNHNRFVQSNLRIDFKALPEMTLTSLTSFSDMKVDQLADADGTALTNIDSNMRGKLQSISEELRASGDVGRLSYIAGLNYAHDYAAAAAYIDISYSTSAVSLGAPPALPLDKTEADVTQRFDTQAMFANLDYKVTDRLTIRGGVRYTAADLHYTGCSVPQSANAADAFTRVINKSRAAQGLAPIGPLAPFRCGSVNPLTLGPDLYFDKLNQQNLSWRGGIDFKPTPNTLLYVSVSKGYKAGSASTPAATNDLQFTPAKQESVLAYEVGLKTALLNHKVEFTAAAFYYDYRNKQLLGRQVFTPNVFGAINVLTNVPKSEIKGGEAQLTVFPLKGLTLTAAATYLDTRVVGDFINVDILGNSANFAGDPFPYTPKWQVVLDGEYRFPLTSTMQAVLGANANYRTKTTAGFGGSNLLDIDAYWLVDARAGIDFDQGKYRVQIFGRNITNQYYWNNVSRSLDNVRRYAGMPATYGVQFSVRY
ncbi:TonB-dependent receptor [Sphingomonas oligophenolica]|uniref:TonB-dependent receptor n=2 Tax=Sphingomonas oligophenolica TaxID=301154 RepID=A0ABU9Y8R8_9SPHN